MHMGTKIREGRNKSTAILCALVLIGGMHAWADTPLNNQTSDSTTISIGTEFSGTDNHSVIIGKDIKMGNTAPGGAVIIGYGVKDTDSAANTLIGYETSGSDDATAVGALASAKGKSTAVGFHAEAENFSTALGEYSVATGNQSSAIGYWAKAQGAQSVAIGQNGTEATGTGSLAEGYNAKASNDAATAVGYQASASGKYGIAMGWSTASGRTSVAIGGDGDIYGPSQASAQGAVAIGGGSNATGTEAVAIGGKSKASKNESLAVGANSSTSLANSVAIGAYSKTGDSFSERQTSITLDGTTYTFAGKPSSDNGVFSIGDQGKERVLINVAPGQINENSTDAINGSQLHATNQTLVNLNSQAVKYDVMKDGKVDKTHITLAGGGTTISNVADTAIEEGSMNAVNGGTVYRETRASRDGTYIRKDYTAAQNLEALDQQVSSNASSIYQLDSRVGELDSRMNKVGAGAAALAALHPLDYDPHDKWDFSAGVGNYKNATAAAVGLFYRPNERTLFNIGWTMGDNRNMVNGGFSVKLGKGSPYNGLSRAEMARTISLQSDEIKAIRADNEVKGKRIDALEEENRKIREENQEMKRQIQAIWDRLGK